MSKFAVPAESRIRYLTRRLDELAQLQEKTDLELAKKVGHQIKGNAATFLFPELATMGADLENAALANSAEDVRVKALEIQSKVHELLKSLE